MTSAKITALAEELAITRSAISNLDETAVAESRDLTVDEESQSVTLIERMDTLKADLEAAEAKQAKLDAVDALTAKVRSASPLVVVRSEAQPVNAGEFMSAFMQQAAQVGDKGAKYRALATTYMVDVPGLLPTVTVQGLIDRFNSSRPVYASFNQQGNVPAWTFEQGVVDNDLVYTDHVNEGDEVASGDYKVSTYTIQAKELAGATKVSARVAQFSQPSVMQGIAEGFTKKQNERSEIKACAALAAAATTNTGFSTTSVASFVRSIMTAVLTIEGNTGPVVKPTVWLDNASYVDWASLVNGQDELLITSLKAQGLEMPTIVRSHKLPPYSSFIGDADKCKAWETRAGETRLFQVSTLDFELGEYGWIAFDIEAGSVLDLSYAGS